MIKFESDWKILLFKNWRWVSLISWRNAFSAGGHMIVSYKFLKMKATTCAQFEKIEQNQVAVAKGMEKKEEDFQVIVKKTGELFWWYKLEKNVKELFSEFLKCFFTLPWISIWCFTYDVLLEQQLKYINDENKSENSLQKTNPVYFKNRCILIWVVILMMTIAEMILLLFVEGSPAMIGLKKVYKFQLQLYVYLNLLQQKLNIILSSDWFFCCSLISFMSFLQ